MSDEKKPTYEELQLFAAIGWGCASAQLRGKELDAWLHRSRGILAEICVHLQRVYGEEAMIAWIKAIPAKELHEDLARRSSEVPS